MSLSPLHIFWCPVRAAVAVAEDSAVEHRTVYLRRATACPGMSIRSTVMGSIARNGRKKGSGAKDGIRDENTLMSISAVVVQRMRIRKRPMLPPLQKCGVFQRRRKRRKRSELAAAFLQVGRKKSNSRSLRKLIHLAKAPRLFLLASNCWLPPNGNRPVLGIQVESRRLSATTSLGEGLQSSSLNQA